MEQQKIKVLIKVNDNNEITEITSSVFANENDGYIVIDEGVGDRFTHAQNLYLAKPLFNENGEYNYKYLDNKVIEI